MILVFNKDTLVVSRLTVFVPHAAFKVIYVQEEYYIAFCCIHATASCKTQESSTGTCFPLLLEMLAFCRRWIKTLTFVSVKVALMFFRMLFGWPLMQMCITNVGN